MGYFYKLCEREKLFLLLSGISLILIIAYFFYRSLWAVLPLLPLFFIYRRYSRKRLIHKKKEELRYHFKEMMEVISGYLKAGYSAENAFLEAYREMKKFYGIDSPVERVLAFIKTGIENHIPLEERIREAGEKSGIEEIKEFAAVFWAAKLSGGNMVEIMERTAAVIGGKIEVENAINVTFASRKAEQKIMNIVPFFILTYLDVTSPGFFRVLYHNLTGIVIMSICLVFYLLAYVMSVKMLAVEV